MPDNTDTSLLRTIPRVLRARDFHLYLEGGKRLTDLWRSGGQVVLGHKPPKVLGELKNACERGLFSALPHPTEQRFLKALAALFPNKVFRLYTNDSSLRRALARAGFTEESRASFPDPAFPPQDGFPSRVSLWRPFLTNNNDVSVYVPVLPFPLAPSVLIINREFDHSFSASDLISPVVLSPAVRALYNLISILKVFDTKREYPYYPKLHKALSQFSSDSQQVRWHRKGIYLTVDRSIDNDQYATMFKQFLSEGFLLPPSSSEPAILPLEMSDGEEAKFAGLLIQQWEAQAFG